MELASRDPRLTKALGKRAVGAAQDGDGMYGDNRRSSSDGVRPRLRCSGIWGGIRNIDQDVTAGRVVASLYSASAEGGKGGDIYFFGVCKGDRMTRLAIADVVGHGQAVSDVSQHVYDSLKSHMCDADDRTILSDINQFVSGLGLVAMTTAAVVAYDAERGMACVSYAGHPPVLIMRHAEVTWSFAIPTKEIELGGPPTGLPLAVARDTQYGQFAIPAAPGDRLFVYTDGVTETSGPDGELFGSGRLRRVLDADPNLSIAEVKRTVLRALKQHSSGELKHDDVTLIVLEIS